MGYELKEYSFAVEEFLPVSIMNQITELRVDAPGIVESEAAARKQRETLTRDGYLTILACDHPGRMVTSAGSGDPLIMGNRQQYLGRILRVITDPSFDGVMTTPDIMEDLFFMDYLVKENGGESFLDEKVLMGCMNRGGLAGTVFEMDDRMTAFTAERMAELRLDAAKVMFRIDINNPESGKTLLYCADAVSDCYEVGLPAFVEPLPVVFDADKGKFNVQKNAEALIKVVGVASALGQSSLGTWLKIPYCENYESVALATTLPILMLGGEAKGDPTPLLADFANGMKAGENVRGALVGRNILFPGADDPLATALAVNSIVHEGASGEDAIEVLMDNRGQNMNLLTELIA